jgi:tripartite-type tricarboxylate transporter receptor subunit TctC
VYQVLKGGVKYDAAKFNYIGRAGSMQYVIMVWHDKGVKTLDDMKKTEIIFGATGKSQSNYMVPILLKNVLGLKARVITGYPGTKDISLALEKGEVGGRAGAWSSWQTGHAHWLRENKVIPVAQSGLEKATDLPNAPLLLDLAKNDEERAVLELLASDAAVGRGFMMPPGVPAERVQAMRRAFDATMADPAFLAEAKKRRLLIEPMTGEKLQEIVKKTVAASPEVVSRAKKVLEW